MLELFLILFFSIFILISVKRREIFEPAKLFTIIWIVQIILTAFLFNNAYVFSGLNFIYMFTCIVVILIGSSIGKSFKGLKKVESNNTEFNICRANRLFYTITILAFIYPFVKISQYGFGINFFLNLNSLLEMNNVIANERYTGAEINTLFDQILLVFLYLAPLYGGYVLAYATKRKWIYYLVLIPPLLVAITQSMKAGFISSVFMFLASRAVSIKIYSSQFPVITFKTIVKAVFAGLLFFGVLFFSMLLRTNEINAETIEMIGYRFMNYSLGHMVAFDVWLNNLYDPNTPFELKTFYGISNLLGIGERIQGVFGDFIDYSNANFPESMVTNVFSLFRFLIEDFGIFGSFIFLFLFGVLSGYSFAILDRCRFSNISIVILTSSYAYILFSLFSSLWAYTSYIATFILFYFILKISYSKRVIVLNSDDN